MPRLQILMIDDNEEIREAVADLLRRNGNQVVEAQDGRLGLIAMEERPRFDVIILDLVMPVMDGPTFLAHKLCGDHAEVPVVIFSSSVPAVRMKDFGGVAAFVAKEAGVDCLLEAIEIVGQRAARERAADVGECLF